MFRDLRYIRVRVDDLDAGTRFARDSFGLQVADRNDDQTMFRSDMRNYALCLSRSAPDAVALTVAHLADLDALAARLGHAARMLGPADCAARQVKAALAVTAPNGVVVEVVWRPLTSGWRYHGPRDAGITGLQAVAMACTNIAADQAFWTGLGLGVTDWAGDAAFLALDSAHHRVALYPSTRDGLLGATWAVEGKDFVMQNWYHLQKSQVPVVAGPDRQPTSNAMFVTARSPFGLLMSYAAETDDGPHIAARGPRQFPDTAASHGAWGAPTTQPEFKGASHD